MSTLPYTLDDPPFAGRTGIGVTIAVLDSGIHPNHPHVGVVDGGTSLLADSTDHVDRLGHGTAVAAAIREKAPAARLLAVKVFHRQLATSIDVLARAIEWAAGEGAHLINLSLGTDNAAHADRLSMAVEHAVSRGAIVVSAHASGERIWYPGSLPGVAGVTLETDRERDEIDVIPHGDAMPSFAASPYPRPISGVPRERNVSGVSFAVANVTGFLARAIEAGGGAPTADVLRELATRA